MIREFTDFLKTGVCRSIEKVLQQSARDNYILFPWTLLWEINYLCNLKCIYCCHHSDPQLVDPEKVLERIIEIQPKMLTISGGEPLLLNNIEKIVRTIRKRINPILILNTNLVTRLDHLLSWLDQVDVIHTSIDGLGEINKATRGISGDVVIKNIKKVLPVVEKAHKGVILTMSVMRNDNYMHAADLIREIAGISPRLIMAFAPQEPVYDPASLGSNPENMQKFRDMVLPLRGKYNFYLAGTLATPLTRDFYSSTDAERVRNEPDSEQDCVRCARQYFRMKVDPMGKESTCKPDIYIGHFMNVIGRKIWEGNRLSIPMDIVRAVHSLRIAPTNLKCWAPCKCEEFIDDILRAKENEPVPPHSYDFAGRFNSQEIKLLDRFTHAKLGKQLAPKVRKILTGESASS
jgi:MoaA/NifB/PqqE/SkfB family radical SAM enzyme